MGAASRLLGTPSAACPWPRKRRVHGCGAPLDPFTGLAVVALVAMISTALPATDPNRCQRAEVGNTIGQANAVSDKVSARPLFGPSVCS